MDRDYIVGGSPSTNADDMDDYEEIGEIGESAAGFPDPYIDELDVRMDAVEFETNLRKSRKRRESR